MVYKISKKPQFWSSKTRYQNDIKQIAEEKKALDTALTTVDKKKLLQHIKAPKMSQTWSLETIYKNEIKQIQKEERHSIVIG